MRELQAMNTAIFAVIRYFGGQYLYNRRYEIIESLTTVAYGKLKTKCDNDLQTVAEQVNGDDDSTPEVVLNSINAVLCNKET